MYRLALIACALVAHQAKSGDVYVLKPDGKVEKRAAKDLTYEQGYALVAKGRTLMLAVGVPHKKGEVQAPDDWAKGKVPGVYKWYLHNGAPCCDAKDKVGVLLAPVQGCSGST